MDAVREGGVFHFPVNTMALIDSFGRTIDYLRVSVTDRCNFRCVYCMPEEGAPIAPKEQILRFEEIERLLRIAAGLGMRKVRLTGGEPLVRKDIVQLVERVGSIPGIEDISLTTNGLLLPRLAADMARGGLNRVNISLDTLRPERFQAIARRGSLDDVLSGIDASLAAGLSPIKLNAVVMRGVNDDEVADFAAMTRESPFHVRFIELMPINWSTGDDSMRDMFALSGAPAGENVRLFAKQDAESFRNGFRIFQPAEQQGMLNAAQMRRMFISAAEIRERIESALGLLEPAEVKTNGPARTFRLPGALGTVGFISQITNDICASCNRLRLTADGFLRPCLMADGEVDLRTPLRTGSSDEDIRELFRLTVKHKPFEHRLEDGMAPVGRNMSQLGG
jgi:cyclic pyranopterin phosphate synthase